MVTHLQEHRKDSELLSSFQEFFAGKMNLARIKFLVLLIQALCKVQTVSLYKLATAFDGGRDHMASHRHIQRFFAAYVLNLDLVARFIFFLLPEKDNLVLSMDRTNWKFGDTDINVLTLAVTYKVVGFPIHLKRCSYDEQFRLRRFLYNEGAPMLIASVKKLYPALTEYKAPFFEGLKKIHLHPISVDVIESLFDERSLDRAIRMYNLISPTIRSVEIICNIIQTAPDPNRDIGTLLSYFSDRYSLIYQSVPINSQRILNICCVSDSGLTVPELRDKSNLSSGTLTPYLRNLCQQGLVTADKSIKRNTIYLVKDPLFRIWLRSQNCL